jgi:hypothetical protein
MIHRGRAGPPQDDCWNHAGASTAVQCQERPGLHNACSMASPQDKDRTNTSRFKPYVTDIIGAHSKDARVLWWGVFNEPHKSGFSVQLRHAAYGWATALNPMQPVISCWDRMSEHDNLDSEMQNVHHYNADFRSLTAAAWQGLAFSPTPQGSLVTEAGCRWFQGSSGSSGSPLEMINWLKALRAAGVSRPFSSWNRPMLTEIYLCHACSYHEIEDGNGRAGPIHPWCDAQLDGHRWCARPWPVRRRQSGRCRNETWNELRWQW